MVVMMTDASFARQPREGSQQGLLLAVGDRRLVFDGEAPASPVAWSSTRIKRVVRSTLAAEAAALAAGYDLAVFVRSLLAEMLMTGPPEPSWERRIQHVAQLSWTDCKSLHDMLAREGSLPTEKRVALDVADVRQYLLYDDLEWVSTGLMLADPLTKPIARSEVSALQQFLASGSWKTTSTTAT